MNKFSNISEYTVSQVNKAIKNIIEGNFNVIKVIGELSQVKRHSSGHIYFTLKDQDSTLSGVCWRSNTNNLKVNIEDGKFVLIKGKITTYAPQSKYQLIVDEIEYQGEGELLKILEERKKKLLAEGLFDLDKKKKIPKIPKNIGIITSETGAVFKDILHRINDRFPTNLIFFSVKVQGEGSLNQICEGINFFNNLSSDNKNKPNVIILARGGGSLEDLMVFNEEFLVRTIHKSKIPSINTKSSIKCTCPLSTFITPSLSKNSPKFLFFNKLLISLFKSSNFLSIRSSDLFHLSISLISIPSVFSRVSLCPLFSVFRSCKASACVVPLLFIE